MFVLFQQRFHQSWIWGKDRSEVLYVCVKLSSHFIPFIIDGEPESADGKIMFRKPAKRSSEKVLDFNVSSSKKMKKTKKTDREATSSQSTAKQVKNSSLLSFDDEENDDQDCICLVILPGIRVRMWIFLEIEAQYLNLFLLVIIHQEKTQHEQN